MRSPLMIPCSRREESKIWQRWSDGCWSDNSLLFQAGERISLVGWRKVDFSESMYAAHLYILKLITRNHDASF